MPTHLCTHALEHYGRSCGLQMHLGVVYLSIFFFLCWFHCPSLFLKQKRTKWYREYVQNLNLFCQLLDTTVLFLKKTFHCVYSLLPFPHQSWDQVAKRREARCHLSHFCQRASLFNSRLAWLREENVTIVPSPF